MIDRMMRVSDHDMSLIIMFAHILRLIERKYERLCVQYVNWF